jgi:replicative DNA helicase
MTPETAEQPYDTLDILDSALCVDRGIPTGFPNLDTLTGGLQPGHLTVIAGRPSHGCSTLALTLTRAAVTAKRETYFAALQSSVDDTARRFAAAESQVAMHWITAGVSAPAEAARMEATRKRIQAEPLPLILDSPLTFAAIDEILNAYDDGAPELLVIDGVDLLDAGTDSRLVHERAAAASHLLKSWAIDRQMHVIVTVHLAPRTPKNYYDRPTLDDFGARHTYAHDADLVILVHRPDADLRDTPRLGEVDLILAKHRNGPTAVLTAAWQGHFGRIVPMVEPEPLPEPDEDGQEAVASEKAAIDAEYDQCEPVYDERGQL